MVLDEYNVEVDGRCPELLLLKDEKRINKIDTCSINMAGYRSLNALTDFAYIKLKGFRLDQGQIIYSADMELLQGNAMKASCKVAIEDDQLVAHGCMQE